MTWPMRVIALELTLKQRIIKEDGYGCFLSKSVIFLPSEHSTVKQDGNLIGWPVVVFFPFMVNVNHFDSETKLRALFSRYKP